MPYHPVCRDFIELRLHILRELVFKEGGEVREQEFNHDDSERLDDEFSGLTTHLSNFCFGFYRRRRAAAAAILGYRELAALDGFARDVLEFDIPAFLDFIHET